MRKISLHAQISSRAHPEPVEGSAPAATWRSLALRLRQAQPERALAVALLAFAATACTPNDVTLGGALRHDVAMQTIDPEPTYRGTEIEGGSGTHGAAATERYRKGTVKEPQSIKTTSGSGGGSGGSGGGSK